MGLKEKWQDLERQSIRAVVVSMLILVPLLWSCKSPQRTIEQETNQNQRQTQREVIVNRDTIIYRDSIIYREKGDTIEIREIRYRDIIRMDTLVRVDTLQVEKIRTKKDIKIEKKISWKRTLLYALIGTVLISVIGKKIIKRIKR